MKEYPIIIYKAARWLVSLYVTCPSPKRCSYPIKKSVHVLHRMVFMSVGRQTFALEYSEQVAGVKPMKVIHTGCFKKNYILENLTFFYYFISQLPRQLQ